MKREACIIAGTRMDGRTVLFKNRDRAYDANLRVYQAELDGTEVAFVFDLDSGYLEGLNEFGIGVVNTSLMVRRDEDEGRKKRKKEIVRSEDGPKILEALAHRTIEGAVDTLVRKKIRGHTFVCQGDTLVCIEASKTHKPCVRVLDLDRINTRTNHGVAYPDAGYTQGEDYISSIARRWEAQKQFQQIEKPEDMATTLVKSQIDTASSPFNPVRNTSKMRTTNQVMMDLDNGILNLYMIPKHSRLHRIRNTLDREPKIQVKIWRYQK